MPLDPRFKLVEAANDEMDDAFRMLELAYRDDGIWKFARENCDDEDIHQWMVKYILPRWLMPDIDTYLIKEVSTGKIVAWTALQFPWKGLTEKDKHYMSPEMKAAALSHDFPPLTKGMEREPTMEFFISLSSADRFGYDHEKDFHRKGTMVHPSFQKLGLGTFLTHHANAISDKAGLRVWAPARPTSIKMFRDNGFTDRGELDAHAERWGGTREWSITFYVCRDPPKKE